MKKDDVRLAREWPIPEVERVLDDSSQQSLITFMRARYSERYFEPLDILNSPREGPGFAVMSLCCLLVETFQAYRTGLPTSNEWELKQLAKQFPNPPKPYRLAEAEFPKNNGEPFRCFFISNARFFPGVDGGQFYKGIRNGLLHQSQTKDGWRIRIGTGKLWDKNKLIVDRGLFVCHLRMYFNAYLEELRGLPLNDEILARARRKIWWLCQLSKPK